MLAHKLKYHVKAYWQLMRFDKPVGILLLLWPMMWGLWVASYGRPHLIVLAIFVAGVVVMRAAGCVINDYADRHFDRHVSRTAQRPLTSGKIAATEALVVFGVLAAMAFWLVSHLNELTIKLAVVGLILAVIYPFTKRVIHLPQLWLGLAFAWSIPMVFAAQTKHVPGMSWLIFIAAVLWPLAYDTQYAMVDRADDVKIGVKSTAILFGSYDRLAIGVIQVTFIAVLSVLGVLLHLKLWFYLGLGGAVCLMVYQAYLIRNRDRQACFNAFLSNQWIGLIIFLGLFLSYLN